MARWKFLGEHAMASGTGLIRLLLAHPVFAITLLGHRAYYFLNRKLKQPFLTPNQFLIDTPDTLIAYWSMFVEHELYDPLWAGSLRAKPNPLVVDVGANAGVFSHFVHCLKPDAQFVCFEPLPAMAERIRALAQRSRMNLVCHQKAVSSQSGEANFESPHGYEGTSRLSTETGAGQNVFRVETTTLDEVLAGQKATVIKIDVEGYECDVLKGGMTVVENADFLIMEAQTPQQRSEIMRALGSNWRHKKLGSSDLLFYR